MAGGWRRAFCTTIPRDRKEAVSEKQQNQNEQSNISSLPSHKLSSIFGFFSNPSTPRLKPESVSSPPILHQASNLPVLKFSGTDSPKLQCKTSSSSAKNSPRFFQRSAPPSPKSPSGFSLLKTTLRLTKIRCGICLQNVKAGQGTAIFTAECSHGFHFPCIAAHVKHQTTMACPVCSVQWKELPLLDVKKNQIPELQEEKIKKECAVTSVKTKAYGRQTKPSDLKVYDDDEPLMSPTSGARFNPIPESDENEEEDNDEFQGFSINSRTPPQNKLSTRGEKKTRNVDISVLPESAVISVGQKHETYAVVLKIKGPPAAEVDKTLPLLDPASRAPIDLVTVLDVSGSMSNEKIQMMKRAMRLVISSLSPNDRLSIVAFSAMSKRLFPLKRMTMSGRQSARRLVDAIISTGRQGACAGDALKKAAKVLEDRREKNPVATIMLLSDGQDERMAPKSTNHGRPPAGKSSTRFAQLNIPVQSFNPRARESCYVKCVGGLSTVAVQDLRLQLRITAGSTPAEISAVYSTTGRPSVLEPGSIRLGDMYCEEERELLIELRVPSTTVGSHHFLSVRSSHRDPLSQELVFSKEESLVVIPHLAVRSPSPEDRRLRSVFISTRAVAESRRAIELNDDLIGAQHLLTSTRALLMQSGLNPSDECFRGVDAELAELNRRRKKQQGVVEKGGAAVYVDEKGEPLTPTSAWRAAERLAKVAIMRKSANRVGDLHGFENARF